MPEASLLLASLRYRRNPPTCPTGSIRWLTGNDTSEWVATSSSTPNPHVALALDLMEFNRPLFEKVLSAVQGQEDTASVRSLPETCDRYMLWEDDKHMLDQKLSRAPDMRRPLIENLALLALTLYQGRPWLALDVVLLTAQTVLEYHQPQQHRYLGREVSRMVEQASSLTGLSLSQDSGRHPSGNIVDLQEAEHRIIKSIVDRLLQLLPDIDHMWENSDDTDSGGNQEARLGEDRIDSVSASDTNVRISRSLNVCHDANNHISLPDLANSNTERSLTYTEPSIFSDSAHPQTDTNSSTSASRALSSRNEGPPLNPSRVAQDGSFGRKKLELIEPIQIWNRNGTKSFLCRASLDTGSSGNFIDGRIVRDCDLVVLPLADEEKKPYKAVDGHEIHVNSFAKPDWRFVSGKEEPRQNMRFSIVKELPGELDMVIGGTDLNWMNIGLYADLRSFTAFRNGQNGSS